MTSSQAGIKLNLSHLLPLCFPFYVSLPASPRLRPTPSPLRFQFWGASLPSVFAQINSNCLTCLSLSVTQGSSRAGSQRGFAQPPWEWKQVTAGSGRDPEEPRLIKGAAFLLGARP